MPRLYTKNIDWKKSVHILRCKSYLSQEQFAQCLGAVSASISKWERGEHSPQPRYIRRMMDFALSKGFTEDQWLLNIDIKRPMLVKQ